LPQLASHAVCVVQSILGGLYGCVCVDVR